jgi:hypothetical protein
MASPQPTYLNRSDKAYVLSSPAMARAHAKMRHAPREDGQRIVWIGFLVSVFSALLLFLIFALQE